MTPDRRRSWAGGLVGGALLLSGAGALVLAWALPDQPAEVMGVNRPVNAGAGDPADVTAHNSPAIARNPTDATNLVVANRVDAPEPGCALHVSHDTGATWTPTSIPADDDRPCFAPDVSFGPDGRLYMTYVTLAGLRNEPAAGWIATSTDGGATLSDPVQALDAGAFQVSVTADPTRPGRIYLAWLDAAAAGPWGFDEPGHPLRVQRSDDAGATWEAPVTVNAPGHRRALAPTVQAGPDGGVWVAYLDLGEDDMDYHGSHDGQGGRPHDGLWALAVARSADGGATWDHTDVDTQIVPAERIIAFFPPRPGLAVDGDRVHVAFHDARHGDADVWLWTSPDRGQAFGERVRVDDTDPDDPTAQYLPALDLAAGDGRLDVVYYDRRDDPDNTLNHVSLQSSHDHGRTFSPRVQLSDEASDSRVGDGSERNLADLGSRLALTATPDQAIAVWTDTRAGTPTSGKQDLAHARVAFTPAAAWRAPLLAFGLAAAAVGLTVTAWWTRARRHTNTAVGRRRPAPAHQ